MPNYHSTFSQMHLLEWALLRIAKKYSLELQRKKTDRHDESKSKLSWRRLETLLKVMMILWHLFIAWQVTVENCQKSKIFFIACLVRRVIGLGMGFVLVLSLPFILFTVLLGFGCFLLGRAKGREEARAAVYAAPMAPPEVVARKEGPGNV
ncbi:hypothetical protein ZIOFF_067752 [Zingiber officinale]|uniref:Transmembrane protein n=1 Tax=Zingiber officinale TaxID=94328 RepID=A0A8J5CG10_ZINOF|nr:hypothetical protein ZIOFF_067752 [Zingiber officinale]